jgi:hypothetical protein
MTPDEPKAELKLPPGAPNKGYTRPELMRMFKDGGRAAIKALQYTIAEKITRPGKTQKIDQNTIDAWYLLAGSLGVTVERREATVENVQKLLEEMEASEKPAPIAKQEQPEPPKPKTLTLGDFI